MKFYRVVSSVMPCSCEKLPYNISYRKLQQETNLQNIFILCCNLVENSTM